MREIVNHAIHQAHLVISVITGIFYPVTHKDLVVGEVNTDEKGYGKK